MRKTLLMAALATSFGVPTANAEDLTAQLSLSPADPKYNSPACGGIRQKAQNFNGNLLQQSPEAYVFAAVAPGGTVGFLALMQRKKDLLKRDVEQACMTNPPDRSYLDTTNKD
jgi:hypothetical protein